MVYSFRDRIWKEIFSMFLLEFVSSFVQKKSITRILISNNLEVQAFLLKIFHRTNYTLIGLIFTRLNFAFSRIFAIFAKIKLAKTLEIADSRKLLKLHFRLKNQSKFSIYCKKRLCSAVFSLIREIFKRVQVLFHLY